MNFETMSKQRKMMLIAAAVGVIAMFLPWWSFIVSINGMHGTGILVFLCFLAAGAMAVMGDQTANLTRTNWMIALIASGLASLIMTITFLSNLNLLSLLSIGFYLALIASVALLAITYMHRSAGDTIQSGFDHLKRNFDSRTGSTTHVGGTTPTRTNVSHTPSSTDPNRSTA